MSIKSFLTNLISTNLASGSDILASEHRAVENALVDEMFPTTHTMLVSLITPNVISYDLKFSKIGNLVTLTGVIKNGFATMIGSQTLLTIDNPLYFAKTGEPCVSGFSVKETTTSGWMEVSTNQINLRTNLGSNNTMVVNITYKTND